MMEAALPPTLDLPDEFPVFPLSGALLLPHGRLPLNIFERRYLAMVEDALGEGRVFGMIQPDPSLAATPTGPGLYKVGCLGRLSSFSETDDGRYLITLNGIVRFRIKAELEMRRGYRRVRAGMTEFERDLDEPADLGPLTSKETGRAELVGALRRYFVVRGFEANWDAIDQMPDAALVITLCMVCPFDPAEKQALLEAPTPADRSSALLALLQMGSHEPDNGLEGRRAS